VARPLDAITAFHNAFRRDIARIDQAALSWARGEAPAPPDLARYRFFNEVLVWHANGEEAVVFPFIEREAPLLSEPYIQDHHGLDTAYERLHAAVEAGDALEAARGSAAFKFHLDLHLAKEDKQVYALIRERIRLPDEQGMVGTISGMTPRERFPEVIAWIFPLLIHGERQALVDVFQSLMPPEVFAGVKGLIRNALGDDWNAITALAG
jgi:hemerythrin-like domain-containing protein